MEWLLLLEKLLKLHILGIFECFTFHKIKNSKALSGCALFSLHTCGKLNEQSETHRAPCTWETENHHLVYTKCQAYNSLANDSFSSKHFSVFLRLIHPMHFYPFILVFEIFFHILSMYLYMNMYVGILVPQHVHKHEYW